MQKYLHEHFDLPGHTSFLDVTVTLLDKTDLRNPTERDYWIYTLKTKVPLGLNMENGLLD